MSLESGIHLQPIPTEAQQMADAGEKAAPQIKIDIQEPALKGHDARTHSIPCQLHEQLHKKLKLVENEQGDDLATQRKLYSFFEKLSMVTDREHSSISPEPLRKTADQVAQWVQEGYSILEILKEKKKGYPWESILLSPHPAIMEQLIQLYRILGRPPFTSAEPQAQFLMQQALIIGKQPSLPVAPIGVMEQSLERTFSELGKLIFAAEKSPQALIAQILKHKGKGLADWAELQMKQEMNAVKVRIDTLQKIHATSGLQQADVASKVALIREICSLIVLSDATINIGIIDLLIDGFLHHEKSLQNHDLSLASHLPLIKCDPRLRQILSQASIPPSNNTSSLAIIHAIQPSSGKAISKRDVVLAILSGFLSHLRQGPNSSCFSTFLAINMLAARPDECLKDFLSLLKDGALTRRMDGITIQYPFIISPSSPSLYKPFTLSPSGKVSIDNIERGFLWDAPGIAAIAQSLNMQDIPADLLKWIQAHEPLLKKPLTVDTLIKALAPTSGAYQSAVLAFEAQESNPLLLAWEKSIAGMAETNLSGFSKSAAVQTALNTIKSKLSTLEPPLPKPTLELFCARFNDELLKSARMQYDSSLVQEGVASDQKSVAGGFILYDRNGSNKVNEWTRIDTPQQYQQFILKIAQAVSERTPEQRGSKIGARPSLETVLREYICSNAFLADAIKNSSPHNQSIPNPLSSVNELRSTPWSIKGGNNPKKVLKIYLETKSSPRTQKFTPATAKSLLEKIIELGKSTSARQIENSSIRNPYLITPVRTPGVHSFSLMLGHPTLSKAWEDSTDPQQWIEQSVLQTGLAISESLSTERIRTGLLDHCLKKSVPSHKIQEFLNRFNDIEKETTIKEFRYRIKEILIPLLNNSQKLIAREMRKIDGEIYRLLPEESKKKLEDSAVHFADTNWYDGVNDVHFCFVVNPGNGKMEIWEAADNGKNLYPADQAAWLNEHKWEFFEPFFLDRDNL